MLRLIFATIGGIAIAVVTFSVIEYINLKIFPFPQELDIHNTDQLNQVLANAPFYYFILVVAGWMLGSYLGGFFATKISRSTTPIPAVIIASILTVLGIANAVSVTHPLWLSFFSVASYFPFVFLGRKHASPKQYAPVN